MDIGVAIWVKPKYAGSSASLRVAEDPVAKFSEWWRTLKAHIWFLLQTQNLSCLATWGQDSWLQQDVRRCTEGCQGWSCFVVHNSAECSAETRENLGAIAHVEPSQPRRRLAHPHIIAYYDAFFEAQWEWCGNVPKQVTKCQEFILGSRWLALYTIIFGNVRNALPFSLSNLSKVDAAKADQLHIVLEFADGGLSWFQLFASKVASS